jgi:hypothetical protein
LNLLIKGRANLALAITLCLVATAQTHSNRRAGR